VKVVASCGASVLLLTGCGGTGTDIGPGFGRLPVVSCKVQVVDDQGRGVVGARVEVLGTGIVALTGPNGRADLLADLRGSRRLRVDGNGAAATAGDRLGTVIAELELVGADVPSPIVLPDLTTASDPFAAGTLVAPVVLTSAAGAEFTATAGTSIGTAGGDATIVLRVGDVARGHLPGTLPTTPGAALLFGAGVAIEPIDVTFTPPADLELDDDLGLVAGAARLYRLDPDTGRWTEAVAGIAASGGRLAAPGAIARGGIYAFATEVAATTVVGTVVDGAAAPLPGIMVGVDGRWVASAAGGAFTVTGVPAVDGSGAARLATVELYAGGDHVPARSTAAPAVANAITSDVGALTLDTVPGANLRVQAISRGRELAQQAILVGTSPQPVALAGVTNDAGQLVFEDLPRGPFGIFLAERPTRNELLLAQNLGRLRGRWDQLQLLFSPRVWSFASSRTRVLVLDAAGGAPIAGAAVIAGRTDGAGLLDTTRDLGTVSASRRVSGRATAVASDTRAGRTIVHAVTVEAPNGDTMELPLQRVARARLGAFERHGLVAGAITGGGAGTTLQLRASRRLELEHWVADVVDGAPLPGAVPLDLDPATNAGAFRIGVPPGGSLAAAEIAPGGGRPTLEQVGFASGLDLAQAAVLARDVALGHAATQQFAAVGALAALDATIAASDLEFDLASLSGAGVVVDVARDLQGNLSFAGADAEVRLPPLVGARAHAAWLVHVHGTGSSGGVTNTQSTVWTLRAGGGDTPALAPVPMLSSPAAGATIGTGALTIAFQLPAGAILGRIELRSDTGTDLRRWEAWVPPTLTELRLQALPTTVPQPLVAGRTYTLSVHAYFGTGGPVRGANAYRAYTSYLFSIGTAERGIRTVSSTSITVTTS
jgi:hypothetical protein